MTVRANTSVNLPGHQLIAEGDLFDEEHEWVRKYPQFFDDVETRTIRPVEKATAAPGERRDTAPSTTATGPKKAPAKKAPAKKAPAKKAAPAKVDSSD